MLRVEGLDVRFGPAQVLHGVSLHVEPGEVVALVGANGAGKTTLLRTISGLLRPAAGEIWFDGRRIDRVAAHRVVRLGLGHVPEGRRVFPLLTVHENLVMGGYTCGDRALVRRRMEQVYDLFPRLRERRHQHAGTLSGGEQQMLAIGRGLMTGPKMILLDEPSLGLAPVVVRQVFQAIRQVNRSGVPILLVEQNAHVALRVAHRAYIMQTGRIVLSGPAQELRRDPRVVRTYLMGDAGRYAGEEANDDEDLPGR